LRTGGFPFAFYQLGHFTTTLNRAPQIHPSRQSVQVAIEPLRQTDTLGIVVARKTWIGTQ